MKCHSYSFTLLLVWSKSSVSNDASSDLHLPSHILLLPTNSICLWHLNFSISSFLSNENYPFHIASTPICCCNLLFSICQWFEVLSHKPGSHSTQLDALFHALPKAFCEPTWDEEWETVSLYSHKGVKSKWGRKGPYWKEPFQREGTFSAPEKLWQVHKRAKRTHPAQCKAEGSTPRETANAKEAHRCECGFKSPLATHTVGLRKI